MWRTRHGPCVCWFCENGRTHGHVNGYDSWSPNGWLQVAESLDPEDVTRTRVCDLCAHEEKVEGRR